MKRALAHLLLFLVGRIASADTTAELTEQIKAAAKAEVKESAKSKDALAMHRSQTMEGLVLEFNRTVMESRDVNLLRLVEQVEMATNSDKLEALCRDTAKQIRAEQQQRGSLLVEEMRQTFTTALQGALTAQDAKALDAPLSQIHELVERGRRDYLINSNLPILAEQGQQLWEFLRRWQEYLAGLDSNDGKDPRRRLRNLLDTQKDFSAFMPRSELLARIEALENKPQSNVPQETKAAVDIQSLSPAEIEVRVRGIVNGIHDFRDADQALPRLAEYATKIGRAESAHDLQKILAQLQSLRSTYRDLEKGLAMSIPLSSTNYSPELSNDALYPLREQILLMALPRILGVAGADLPEAGDNASTYLNRVAERARKKANWSLLNRTIDAAKPFQIGTATTSSDQTALQSFLAGINEERARQYAPAVSSYLAALRSGSQMLPPESIGDRLDAIRKDHPQDYEEGMQLVLRPSPFPDLRARTGQPTGNPFPPGILTAAPVMITVPAVATAKAGNSDSQPAEPK